MRITDTVTRWWCSAWAWLHAEPEARQKGSVTIENVVWAIAVIGIAAIVVAAITAYVEKAGAKIGP